MCSCCCCLFSLFTPKGSLDTKINSLPSPLSRMDESMLSSSAQIAIDCNQRTPRVLHNLITPFLSSSPRVVSSSSIRERERERKRKKEKSAQKRRTKILYLKYAKRGKKTSRCYCFSAATRERERDRLRNTYNHAVLSENSHCEFVGHHRLTMALDFEKAERERRLRFIERRLFADERKSSQEEAKNFHHKKLHTKRKY